MKSRRSVVIPFSWTSSFLNLSFKFWNSCNSVAANGFWLTGSLGTSPLTGAWDRTAPFDGITLIRRWCYNFRGAQYSCTDQFQDTRVTARQLDSVIVALNIIDAHNSTQLLTNRGIYSHSRRLQNSKLKIFGFVSWLAMRWIRCFFFLYFSFRYTEMKNTEKNEIETNVCTYILIRYISNFKSSPNYFKFRSHIIDCIANLVGYLHLAALIVSPLQTITVYFWPNPRQPPWRVEPEQAPSAYWFL